MRHMMTMGNFPSAPMVFPKLDRSTEKKYAEHFRNIVTNVRLQRNLTPSAIARLIGIPSSTYQRFESGKGHLSAAAWVTLCSQLDISPRLIISGYIDTLLYASRNARHDHGAFVVPRPYQVGPALNVRVLRPVLNFGERTLGSARLNRQIKDLGLNPAYFVKFDNQINPRFLYDLGSRLLDKTHTSMESFFDRSFASEAVHGKLHEKYQTATSGLQALKTYIQYSNRYDDLYARWYEQDSELTAKVHLEPLESYRDCSKQDLKACQEFLEKYNRLFIERMTRYHKHWRPCRLTQIASVYKGQERCIYQIQMV